MTQAAEVGPEPEEPPAPSPEPEDQPEDQPEDEPELGRPGPAFDRKAPYLAGLLAGLGLLTRVAPALNAFTISFPLKIMLTLTLVSVIFVALPGIVGNLTGQAIKVLAGVG